MPDAHTRRKLILMIDDDASQLEFGRRLCERAGYRFAAAPGGVSGLSLAAEARPDLILLDYLMPDLTGREVFEALSGSDDGWLRHTPVIMLTAQSANRAEQRELLDAGLATYLYKPFGYKELLNVIDNVLALAEARARNRELEREARLTFVATARMLVRLLFAKDRASAEHSTATADLAEALALRCGMNEQEALQIKLGGLLHDVGKIGVPAQVLRKPGRLNELETALMRMHVEYGEEALAGVPHMESVREIVRYHHEWFDGAGYPFGLAGADIPFAARLVSVVDAYDSMTSDRPYRRALPRGEAIRRLREGCGTQFDPALVAALVDTLDTYEAPRERVADLEFLEVLG